MSTLRTLASAFCIVLGALLIASWAASTATLEALEQDTVVEDLTTRAITSEPAQAALVEEGTQRVLEALEGFGVRPFPGLEGTVSALLEAVFSSQGFADAVHEQTASLRTQVVDDLNSDATGSIVVELDFSGQVNAQLAKIPLIGDSLPEIGVPAVPIEVMDQETGDRARAGWEWLNIASDWFGYLGLVLLLVGILVSERKRWYFAKVALAVGTFSAILWAVFTLAEPATLVERLPGGGGVSDVVIEEIAHHVKGTITTTMGYVAIGAMIVALGLFALASRGGTKGSR